MRNIAIILFTLITFLAQAQPNRMTYQALVRGAENELVRNKDLNFEITILRDGVGGIKVFSETHKATTNNNGLVSLQIGSGTNPTGLLDTITWHSWSYFIECKTDPTGGTDYTVTSYAPLLTVPYAFYANQSGPKGNNEGDLRYWDGNKWSILPKGGNGQYLQMNENGIPSWQGVTTPGEPVLGATQVSEIELTAAKFTSEIFGDGGNAVTANGFVLSESMNPEVTDIVVSVGNGVGAITGSINSLKTGVTYYVRAYATNSMGVVYGKEISFTTKVPKVGETGPAGGIIFYIDGNGGGMECAPGGYDFDLRWNIKNFNQTETYARDTSIFGGKSNTSKILNALATDGEAALLCDTFSLNGYNDWYLPSMGQLRLMNWRLDNNGLGQFKKDKMYWSSNQATSANNRSWFAYRLSFAKDDESFYESYYRHYVRPVRTF